MAGITKLAIMVSSCARDRDVECAALNTWMEAWGDMVEHYILLGEGNTYKNPRDWIVNVPDTYDQCAGKVWKAAQFCVQNSLDYIFKCDLDTYVAVPELIQFNPEGMDYLGYRCDEGHAAGGNGYLLSRKACEILLGSPWRTGYQDVWVGETLAKHGIQCAHRPVFAGQRVPPISGAVSMHLGISGQKFEPKWMADCHEAYLDHFNEQS